MKSENGTTLPFNTDTLVSVLSQNLELNLKPHQVLQLIKKLSNNLTGQQKTNLLEHLLGLTTIGHFESLRLATHLHSSCHRMPDCCDFVTWLPAELTLRIFSYLSWKSLVICSEVNKSWLKYARHPELYRHLCMQPQWSSPIQQKPQLFNKLMLSNGCNYRVQDENIQIKHSLDVNWLNVFKKRVCLRRNFRLGKHRIRRFNGHSGAVYCVDCDAYRIVSGSADATIRVWNIRTNAKWSVQTLRGHSDAVRCVQLLSLPHHLSNNSNNVNNTNNHSPPVHCIHESIASIPCSLCKLDPTVNYPNCWEPPEVLLISGSADTTLKLWHLSSTPNWSRIACTCTLQGHTDTVRCVQADHEKVISGSYDCTLRLWSIHSGQVKRIFRGHSAGITCLVYSDNLLYSGSLDNTVRIWNISTGVCYYTLARPIFSRNLPEVSISSSVSCLHLDYAQNRLVVAYHDGVVLTKYLSVLVELMKPYQHDNNNNANTSSSNGDQRHSITQWPLSSDTIYLDEYLYTNDYKSGTLIRCLTGDAWHIICGSDDKSIKVWQVGDNKFVNSLQEHEDGVTCAVISGSVIISGSYDKTVILYDFDVI